MSAPPAPHERTLAAVCSAPNEVRLESLPTPRPGASEMLLRLDCCGLCGTDLYKIARGSHVGRVLGHEVVGTVAAVGENVSGFAIGQRVVTPHHVACGGCRQCRADATTRCASFGEEQLWPGAFSEQILVREPAVRRAARVLPDGLSAAAAVFLEPSACVLRGVDRSGLNTVADAGLEPSVAVLGGGSMGLLHVLVLRCLFPDSAIILSEPLEERRRQALRLGAGFAAEPRELARIAAEHTEVGVDAVFDTVGDPALLESALGLLRPGGTLVLFAHFRDGISGAIHETLFRQEKRIVGTYSGASSEQDRVFDWLTSGRLQPESLVTHSLPLSQFNRAVALATTRSALKVLIVPG